MIIQAILLASLGAAGPGPTVDVDSVGKLRAALRDPKPGTTIRIAPGRYRGDIDAQGLYGTTDQPITICGRDPQNPPVFEQGSCAFHLAEVAHLILQDIKVERMSANGINIDDGGVKTEPSHHIVARNLRIRDVGPQGNRDGLKLSGVADFRVESCTFERWGSGGSGIDMVGCKRGVITGSTFRHGDAVGDNGVQAKGGSEAIRIEKCRFEHSGSRAINLGGSTGMDYFRPEPQGFEGRDLTVEDCVIIGSHAAIAFVNIDGAKVQHNTIYQPLRYAFRILQETNAPGFVPCRKGQVRDNLIVFRGDQMSIPINIGPNTAPETFALARNAWYCSDRPARSKPRLEIPETDGVYGVAPQFKDADRLDLTLPAGGRPRAGVRRVP